MGFFPINILLMHVNKPLIFVTWAPLRANHGGLSGGWVTPDNSAATYATVGGSRGRSKVKIVP
jgi:hypothetical protein